MKNSTAKTALTAMLLMFSQTATQVKSAEQADTIESLAAPAINVAKLIPLVTLQKPVDINQDGDSMMRYLLSIDNYKSFSPDLFIPASYLKPLAEHLNSSRTWVYIKDKDGNPLQTFGTIDNRDQLKNLWFAIEQGSEAPKQVYIDIWDRQTDTHYKSATVDIKTP